MTQSDGINNQLLWHQRSKYGIHKYGRFSIFKMAAIHHTGFLKVGNFNCPYP